MKSRILILSSFLIAILLVSCSIFSSNSFIEYSHNISSLKSNFIVIEKDTISFSSEELFNYFILKDSCGRYFLVLEDGCTDSSYNIKKVNINDTINIYIELTDPYRFLSNKSNKDSNLRGPCGILNSLVIIRKDTLNNIYDVYQSTQLCNNFLVSFN